MTENRDSALRLLNEVFGFKDFRGHQRAIIDRVLSGQDAIVLMPTGGGKSLCYQVPAILRPGVGIIISPLIALMDDQVLALREYGISASALHSNLSYAESQAAIQQAIAGELDLLYIAPERLLAEAGLALMSKLELALFAIDEAHCVAQWGHDFRPEYLALAQLAEHFPSVPRLALTATADESTRVEIRERLALDQAELFSSGFDRPNIRYRVQQKNQARQQLEKFLSQEHPGDSGIVYCLSRKRVEETAAWLTQRSFNALPYHAGMSAEDRQRHQKRFLHEEDVIMVATIAFGMGIDKPDVRFVAHLDLPKSLEAYYQETGRAGRDGLPANAWMAYGLQDLVLVRRLIEGSDAPDEQKRLESRKLNSLLGFCETALCRRRVLLEYFDDQPPETCANCDNCLSPVATWDATVAAQKALSTVYRTGQRFGAAYLTDVLLGVDSTRVKRFDHDLLSTFGLGTDHSRSEWMTLFRQLIAGGYLAVEAEYGGLKLDASARGLLAGEHVLELRQEPKRVKKIKQARAADVELASEEEQDLFEVLRKVRSALAKEHAVPPYVIFSNRTLLEMVKLRPQQHDQMSLVHGVGATKLERYGDFFLTALQDFAAQGPPSDS